MQPILEVSSVTINARDPRALAEFWSALVGGEPRDAGNHGRVGLDALSGRTAP